jgi:hypothetical protein
MELLIRRLELRALPPFTFNAGLAALAVAGGLLLPGWLGRLAGSLLAMQACALLSLYFLLALLFARDSIRAEHAKGASVPPQLEGWTWAFDFLVFSFLIVSFGIGGLLGAVEFVVLVGTAYIGVGRDRQDARATAELVAGFTVAGAALILIAILFRLPEQLEDWAGAPGSVAAAGCYFGAMASAQAARVVPRFSNLFLSSPDTQSGSDERRRETRMGLSDFRNSR